MCIRFGADTVEFDNSLKGVNKALNLLKREYSDINNSLKFDSNNVDLLNKKLSNLEETSRINVLRLEKLKEEQASLGKEKIGTIQWQKYNSEISKTETVINTVKNEINQTKKAINDTKPNSIKNLNKELNYTKDELKIINEKLKLNPNNINLTKERTHLLNKETEQTKRLIKELINEQNKLNKEKINTEEWRNLKRQIDEANISLLKSKQSTKDLNQEAKKTSTEFSIFKGIISSQFVTGTINQIKEVFSDIFQNIKKSRKNLKNLQKYLTFREFNEEKIKEVTNNLKELSLTTRYNFDELSNAFKFLSTAETDISYLLKNLIDINTAAGGTKEDFQTILRFVEQIGVEGNLTKRHWKQINKTLPGVALKLKDSLNIETDFNEALKKGTINAKEVYDALSRIGENEGIKDASKNIKDAESNLKILKKQITEDLNKDLGTFFDDYNKLYLNFIKVLGKTIGSFHNYIKEGNQGIQDLNNSTSGTILIFQKITEQFKTLWSLTNTVTTKIKEAFINTINTITNRFKDFFNYIKQIFLNIWNNLNPIQNLIDKNLKNNPNQTNGTNGAKRTIQTNKNTLPYPNVPFIPNIIPIPNNFNRNINNQNYRNFNGNINIKVETNNTSPYEIANQIESIIIKNISYW